MIPLIALIISVAGQDPGAETRLYRLFQSGIEVGRESYRRTPALLERTATIPLLNLKLETRVELDARGKLARYSGRIQNAAGDTLRLAFDGRADGDSIILVSTAGETSRTRVIHARPDGVIPAQSITVVAEAVARSMGRDTVFQYLPMGIDSLIAVAVRHSGDTARVSLGPLSAILVAGDQTIRVPAANVFSSVWNGVDTLPALRGMRPPNLSYDAPPGAAYTAEHVRVVIRPAQGDTFSLAGTLSLPLNGRRPFPAAVLMSGSGQQDRDENLWPILTDYRPFAQIAERLAREGIAVLRYDDRSAGQSGGSTGGTTAEYTDDVRQLVAWLRARSDIDGDRVALVGHSEGGVMGPLLAAQDARIRALVIMAGPSKNGSEVVRDQFARPIQMAQGITEQERTRLLAGVDSQVTEWLGSSAWTRWFGRHDPLATARQLRLPVLIQHGALDRQVTVGQADTLAATIRTAGNRDVTVMIYPRLNHLFLPTDGDGSPAEYGSLRVQRVPDDVLDDLARWLADRLR